MRIRIFIAALLCMVVLAGCSEKRVDLSKVTESTIGVNADGSIDEAVIEPFEAAYYSLDELKAYIDEEIADFNKAHPQEQQEKKADEPDVTAVTVQSVSLEEEAKAARMELLYLTDDLYNSFNGTNIQFLSMEEAANTEQIAGITDFVSVKKDEKAAFADFSDSSKLHVVCTDTPMRIQTSGKILYYSEVASLIDDCTVQTGEELSVIVFQ